MHNIFLAFEASYFPYNLFRYGGCYVVTRNSYNKTLLLQFEVNVLKGVSLLRESYSA